MTAVLFLVSGTCHGWPVGKVAIAAKSLSVKLKGTTVLEDGHRLSKLSVHSRGFQQWLQGKLFDKINTEESTWHLDNGKQVVVNLEKIRHLASVIRC